MSEYTLTRPTDCIEVDAKSGGKKGSKRARPSLVPLDVLGWLEDRMPTVESFSGTQDIQEILDSWKIWQQNGHCVDSHMFKLARQCDMYLGWQKIDHVRGVISSWHPLTVYALSELYGVGSLKYEDNNWRKGYPTKLTIDALGRHMLGACCEDIDPESQVDHIVCVLWHILAHTFFYIQRSQNVVVY
jgi:hypothetical protein